MALNINTDKLTLVHYPVGAGGKFLINCLSLSDECVFSHATLIKNQLQGQFGQQHKLQYIKEQLESTDGSSWNDLDLGCYQMFGFPVHPFAFSNPKLHWVLEKFMNPEMHDLEAAGKKWFLTTHDTAILRQYLTYWSNAKAIVFVNFEEVLKARRVSQSRPSHQFFNKIFNLDTEIICKSNPTDRTFVWDCNSYFDEEKFLEQIQHCCNWAGLPLANCDDLIWYRKTWLSKAMRPE
jgi:hypothetical protein